MRILMLEDAPRDADLAKRELRRAGIVCEVHVVWDRESMVRELEEFSPDVILSDFAMPRFTGLDAIDVKNERAADLPLIVVTGSINEETAVECIKRGADDYVTKQHLIGLPHAVRGALEKKRLERVEREAEERMRLAARQWRTTFDAMHEAAALLDVQGGIVRCNRAMTELINKPWPEIVGRSYCELVHGGPKSPYPCPVQRVRESLRHETCRTAIGDRWFDLTADPVLDDEGRLTGVVCVIADITEMKRSGEREALHARILAILNRPNEWPALIRDLLTEIKDFTGFSAVGIRLKEAEDYPYYEHNGFSKPFVEKERLLCVRNRDGEIIRDAEGRPCLACMCGTVIQGRTDPSLPCFTEQGSFYTGATTKILDEMRKMGLEGPIRNRCHSEGYESVALIPLRAGDEIIGLLQLTDRRTDRVNLELVRFFEEIGNSIGIAVTRRRTETALRRNEAFLNTLLDAIPVPVFYKDREGRYLGFNRAFETFFGASRERLIGKSVFDISPPELARIYHAKDFELLEKGGVQRYESRIKDAYGAKRDVIFEKAVFTDDEGKTAGLIGGILDITERKRVEEELVESERRLRVLMGNLPGMTYRCRNRPDRPMDFVSDGCLELTGYSVDEILRDGSFRYGPMIHSDDRQEVWDKIQEGVRSGRPFVLEYRVIAKDGGEKWVSERGRTTRTDDHGTAILEGLIIDISERKQAEAEKAELESQYRQLQKMEAVGQLAGGIAHDFNNLLSVIIGYGEQLLDQLHEADPLREAVVEIVNAGERSSALTRQLLAFSRKQAVKPKVLDIGKIVKNLEKMLRRLIGENIELATVLSENLHPVLVDPTQVEQVIMNLVLNARDAMPKGGRLTIETDNVKLEGSEVRDHVGVVSGEYALLAVTDTGCGMDEATRQRVFEPFFTTKELGRGTGLGLSTVYGIVKQFGGAVWLYSEPGEGTTFKIYFPKTEPQTGPRPVPLVIESGRCEGAEVLLVEDEPALRKLIDRILVQLEYEVATASSPEEALELVEEKGFRPELLITDIVMPKMNGKELAERLKKTQPDLTVLFMSGYPDSAIIRHGVLEAETPFLQKPLNISDLKKAVSMLIRESRARKRMNVEGP